MELFSIRIQRTFQLVSTAIRFVLPFFRGEQSIETDRRGKSTCLRGIAQSRSGHCRTVVMFAVLTFHHYLF